MGLFEHIASTDGVEQERLAGNRTIIAAQTRVQDRFDKFVANAANEEDRVARLNLLDDEIRDVVSAVSEEYGYEGDPEQIYLAATAVLSGGHASGCDCGFCANKGKLPGAKDDGDDSKDDEDEAEGEVTAKTAADYPGHDYSIEGGEYVKDWNPDVSRSLESDDESDKEAWHNAKVASQNVSMFHEADGFSYCECDCDGCKTANHCESDKCISTKHSGNPGNSSGETTSSVHTALDVPTGDTFVTERLDLGTSTGDNGTQDIGSPKIDKSQVPGGGGIPGEKGLAEIDVPSKQHPTERQDMHETPEYWDAPIGPSDTGKSVDADTAIQPEHNVAPNTDTWTGTEGQASPVTETSLNAFSAKQAKWQILTTR